MNILHISCTDIMGGRFTGYYMQESLESSHTAEMAVWKRTTDNPSVHSLSPSNFFSLFISDVARRCNYKFGLEGFCGFSGLTLPNRDYFMRADIIHLHVIHDYAYFSILSLPMLSRLKPIVWTVHDSWALTGGCLYSFDCDKWMTGCNYPCEYPRHKSLFQHRMPAVLWQLKKHIYQRADVSLVVASKWMQNRVQRSPLSHNLPCHFIPYGIDLELFRPRSRVESRKSLGISPDQKVIVFRDSGYVSDQFKGLKWLMEALQMYEPREPTCLLVLQDGRAFQSLRPKYDVITPGWIDGEELAIALSAADVFLMPSIQEAFGLMAVESMACGTPVVTFEGTAIPEVIRAPEGGLAVPTRDSRALAEAIQTLLRDDHLRNKLGKQARKIAEQEYSFQMNVKRHVNLYENVIETRK